MPVSWPASLPGPQRTIEHTLGSSVQVRELQSGRRELRRFGAGAPDVLRLQLRLFREDVSTFMRFYERDCNLGLTWFTAPWLALLGYTAHAGRFVGYPQRKGVGIIYSDIAVTVHVKPLADIWADSAWPSTCLYGYPVQVWGTAAGGLLDVPDDLRAIKVQVNLAGADAANPAPWIAALRADGSLVVWGDGASHLAGWEGLTGCKDIAKAGRGLYFLDADGAIGWLGTPHPQLSASIAGAQPPVVTGAARIWASAKQPIQAGVSIGWGVVETANGELLFWGDNEAVTTAMAGQFSPLGVSFNQSWRGGGCLVTDAEGVVRLMYKPPTGSYAGPGIEGAAGAWLSGYVTPTGAAYGAAGGWSQFTTATTATAGTALLFAMRPDWLDPLDIKSVNTAVSQFALLAMALHADGTVTAWGHESWMVTDGMYTAVTPNAVLAAHPVPAGLKARQFDLATVNTKASGLLYNAAAVVR